MDLSNFTNSMTRADFDALLTAERETAAAAAYAASPAGRTRVLLAEAVERTAAEPAGSPLADSLTREVAGLTRELALHTYLNTVFNWGTTSIPNVAAGTVDVHEKYNNFLELMSRRPAGL